MGYIDDSLCARDVATAQLLLERYRDAAATSARALALAGRHVRAPLLSWLSVVRAGALGNLLDLDGALDAIDTAESVVRRQGVPQLLLYVLWQRAVIISALGGAMPMNVPAPAPGSRTQPPSKPRRCRAAHISCT